MLRVFDINSNEIIPVCVVATMSSGKSTFLNAILSEEILPETNMLLISLMPTLYRILTQMKM